MRRTLAIFVALAAVGCEAPVEVSGTPMATAVTKVPWNSDHINGLKLTTRRYEIFTTATSNRVLMAYLPGFMEAAYENYLALTQLPPRDIATKMPIYMMGTRSEWTALTESALKGRSGIYTSIEAGGYCYKGVCVFWDIGGTGTLSVAAHEGLHQFLYHRVRHHLPMWLEEGLCVCAEGYSIRGDVVSFDPADNAARFNNLRAAIVQGYWIPLKRLLSMDAGDVIGDSTERAVGYYGQLWALAMFIRSDDRYRPGLGRLIADAEAGRFHEAMGTPPEAMAKLQLRGRIYNRTVSEPVFRYYISDDLDSFEHQFLTFAKKLAKLR